MTVENRETLPGPITEPGIRIGIARAELSGSGTENHRLLTAASTELPALLRNVCGPKELPPSMLVGRSCGRGGRHRVEARVEVRATTVPVF